MAADKVPKTNHRRLILLAWVFTFGFSVIVAQLIHYQLLQHAELATEAEKQRTWEKTLSSQRGYIADINGHMLACDVVQWDISVSPPLVLSPKELAGKLANYLDLPQDRVYATLTADADWVQLARFVPQDVGEKIADLQAVGINGEPRPLRIYPEGRLLAHVIGIVTIAGDGFYGVEGYHNQQLKGISGQETVEQDTAGKKLPISALNYDPAQAGTNLVLTPAGAAHIRRRKWNCHRHGSTDRRSLGHCQLPDLQPQ
jgi:cell division protein FtsI/penicillin-binding protein 2